MENGSYSVSGNLLRHKCWGFQVADLLKSVRDPTQPSCIREQQYDLCIDKGTYDAISLNPDESRENRKRYRSAVHELTKRHGLFLITSCNWTVAQLKSFFVDNGRWNFFQILEIEKDFNELFLKILNGDMSSNPKDIFSRIDQFLILFHNLVPSVYNFIIEYGCNFYILRSFDLFRQFYRFQSPLCHPHAYSTIRW